jgi:hypothetical protein
MQRGRISGGRVGWVDEDGAESEGENQRGPSQRVDAEGRTGPPHPPFP